MRITELTQCRVCAGGTLEPIFDFGEQALSTRFPGAGQPDAARVPLSLVLCENCGFVQLTHDYDLDDLYRQGYGYRSGVNQTMRDHLGGIVRQLEELVNPVSGDVVLDIASNDATLLKAYGGEGLVRVGIDPTIAQYAEFYDDGMIAAPEFFSADLFRELSPKPLARAISTIAVFYDVPDPNRFVADLASILAPDGVWAMEQSYLPMLLDAMAFDSICHEHLGYYCLRQIERLADANGLRVFDVETNAMNGGSLRVFLCHSAASYARNGAAIDAVLATETAAELERPETFRVFRDKVTDLGVRLKSLLETERAKGKTIHIYGASTKGNVLLQLFGIGRDLIDMAAERNEWKWGCRTPGTNIPIVSEAQSRAAKPDFFLVLPYHFRDEFVAREAAFVAGGGKLIFPLPELEVFPAD